MILTDIIIMAKKKSKDQMHKRAMPMLRNIRKRRVKTFSRVTSCQTVPMRAQERSFRKSKRGTKEQFKKRLRKTAMGLPVSLVKAAVGSMTRRCRAIAHVNGDLFTE